MIAGLASLLADGLTNLSDARGATFLADLALKSTMVLAVAGLVNAALARAAAATRHRVWVVAFAALAVLPLASVGLPSLELAVLPAVGELGSTPAATPPAAALGATGFGATGLGAASVEAARLASAHPGAAGLGPYEPGSKSAGAVDTAVASYGAEAVAVVPALLLTVYLAGMAALLAWLTFGIALVRRWVAGGEVVTGEPAWAPVLAELAESLSLRVRVELVVTPRVRVPMVWMPIAWKPTLARRAVVLLPAAARAWTPALRRDTLVHELAHVERLDGPVQLVARLVRAVYWFHPLAWVALSVLRLEAERACDDRVVAAGSASCDYAERLVELARGVARLRPRVAVGQAAVALSGRSQLSRRVHALLDAGRRRVPAGRAATAGVAAAILLPALLVAPVRLVEAGVADGMGSNRNGEAADADPDRLETARPRTGDLPRSPLGAAAQSGDLESVELLLDAGAEVDVLPRGDATPLMIAARRGHAAVARRLVAAGADVGIVVKMDGTPLIEAVRGGNREIVDLLLDAGADPSVGVPYDGNPLIWAVQRRDGELTGQLLARGADPNAWVEGDESAFFHAVESGDAGMVRLLLDHGADPDAIRDGDGSPLIRAAGSGTLDLVEQLLARGADPNLVVPGDGSPLIAAAGGGHLDTVIRLLAAGADLDQVVPGDETALIQAAAGGHLEVVRHLVERGADLDLRVTVRGGRFGREVRTALSQARRGGHDDVVRYLRSRGAGE